MLVLGLAGRQALGAALDDEEGRAAGRLRQDGVEVGDAAVADELLAAVEAVADRRAVLVDRRGRGLERGQVAARLGLGHAVGDEVARRSATRPSQRGLLLGVAPTLIGSVPRKMARTPVAMPRSRVAISSETR